MQPYSERLGAIAPEQFQRALARFGLGDFVRAEAIPFGLFGQNVFVSSTQGEFVLRGKPHYPWQFPTERFFVEQLHAHTQTPVPYPYLLDPAADIFGWSYVLMPRLPGLQLQDQAAAASLSFDDRSAIAGALARTLAGVQALTWECSGTYDPATDRVRPLDQPYRAWIVQRIRQKLADSLSANEHTRPSDVAWVECLLERVTPALEVPFQPCAVLSDYGYHNAVVSRAGAGWQVSGVFDVMDAHFGDGQADLSVQVGVYLDEDERLARAFVEEYLRLKPAGSGFCLQQQLYMLDLRLSYWRYFQRHVGSVPNLDPEITLEAFAGPSVAAWKRLAG